MAFCVKHSSSTGIPKRIEVCFILLLFYVVATHLVATHLSSYKDWYRLVTVCTHGDFSVAPLGNQAASTMIWYPTQSHYPDTEPTNLCLTLIMRGTWQGSDKINFKVTGFIRPVFEPVRFGITDLQKRETDTQLIRPSRLVNKNGQCDLPRQNL